MKSKPTNQEFLKIDLATLGQWFKENDLPSWLDMTCIYCGGIATTTDHVIPKSQGGKDVRGNKVPACVGCNADKGAQTPEQWNGTNSGEIYHGSPRHVTLAKKKYGNAI